MGVPPPPTPPPSIPPPRLLAEPGLPKGRHPRPFCPYLALPPLPSLPLPHAVPPQVPLQPASSPAPPCCTAPYLRRHLGPGQGHPGQRVHVSGFGTKACSGVGGQCYLAWHASSLHSCCSRTMHAARPMVLAPGTALTTHPTAFTIHAQHCLKPAMPTPPAAMLLLHAPHLVLSHHNHQPAHISSIQYLTALPHSPCYVPNFVLFLHPQHNLCLCASHI